MQVTLTFLCLLGAAAVMAAPSHDVTAPEVTTKSGRVRGVTRTNSQSVEYSEYLGIPYAKPPTGSRRFARPEPADAWTGTRDASHFGPACPQNASGFLNPGPMDEDCLFLNVFAPRSAFYRRPLPVMVWIHGGGYVIGSSSSYPGAELCGKGVVVVTVNYRLGPLGFLSTGDAVAPGNYGLLDQILALQWVKDNIAVFNGDPNKVTIFGESAGATSVSLLLLSPLAKDLFHGVIAESGSSLAPWAVAHSYNYPSQPAIALDLGAKVGCQAMDHAALVACLRTKDAMALATADVIKDVTEKQTWRPVVETEYGVVPEEPLTMLQQGRFHDVPVISGTNMDEMSQSLQGLPHVERGLPAYFFRALLMDFFFSHFLHAAPTLAPRAVEVYTRGLNSSDPIVLRDAWMQMETDAFFFAPSTMELLLLATRGRQGRHWSCYQYVFDHRAAGNTLPGWMGVPHGFELPFVFGGPFIDHFPMDSFLSTTNYSQVDRKVSDDVMTLWSNFAKYGTPTPKAVGGVTWPAFTADNRAFLRLQSALTVDHHLRPQRFDFWSQEVLAAMGVTPLVPPNSHPSLQPHLPALPIVG